MEEFWTVVVLMVIVFLIPCRWDPAIRLKEWVEDWHKKDK